MKANFIHPTSRLSIKNAVTVFLLAFLVGCGTNEKQTNSPLPTSAPSIPSTEPIPSNIVTKPEVTASPSVTDPYQDAISKALGAATITQSAQSQGDWSLIVGMWQEAIDLMEKVPKESSNYALVKTKIQQYQSNLKFAQQMALKPMSTPETIVAVQTSVTKPTSQPIVQKTSSNSTINLVKKASMTKAYTQTSATKPTSQLIVQKTSSNPTVTKASTQTQESTPKASVQKFMEGYFDDTINKGYGGTGSWCASKYNLASSLYSPETWKILDISVYGKNASVRTRIESSTKGGSPIRQNWEFYLEKGDTYIEKQLLKDGSKADYQESKNKNYGWCIVLLSER